MILITKLTHLESSKSDRTGSSFFFVCPTRLLYRVDSCSHHHVGRKQEPIMGLFSIMGFFLRGWLQKATNLFHLCIRIPYIHEYLVKVTASLHFGMIFITDLLLDCDYIWDICFIAFHIFFIDPTSKKLAFIQFSLYLANFGILLCYLNIFCSGINSGMGIKSRRKLAPTDRMSDLDENLIIHILSFLPIEQAMRVCTLSKRWRLLWTYVPTLNFDSSASWGFMHRVLSLHKPRKNIAQFRFCWLTNFGWLNLTTRILPAVCQTTKCWSAQIGFWKWCCTIIIWHNVYFCCDYLTKRQLSYIFHSLHLGYRSLAFQHMILADTQWN